MSHINFLGIPVDGDIIKRDQKEEQRPLSELEPLLRAVINDPTIDSFGWTQATPYFNDGDPCIFSVHEPWFLTATDDAKKLKSDEEEDDEEFDTDSLGVLYGTHPTLGGRDYNWIDRQRVYQPYVGPDEARFDRVLALATALDSGAFDDVLFDAFGDHARVKIKASGITVEFYEHD